MRMTLTRTNCSEKCTVGRLEFTDASGNLITFMTLELPWRDNERGCSCIPTGTYICQRVWSKKFGETFEITQVPDRSGILFHQGNFPSSTRGCVLLGQELAPYAGGYMVTDSVKTMKQFLEATQGISQFTLDIV